MQEASILRAAAHDTPAPLEHREAQMRVQSTQRNIGKRNATPALDEHSSLTIAHAAWLAPHMHESCPPAQSQQRWCCREAHAVKPAWRDATPCAQVWAPHAQLTCQCTQDQCAQEKRAQ